MKTITYNPFALAIVPLEPTRDMDIAGTQPHPNPNWCAGCSPENCPGCGAGPGAYTTPQPGRVTELEAALKIALAALKDFDYDKRMQAIAKINEVLK